MVLADIINYIEGLPPGKEVVLLELTDGETYVSRKFDIVRVALATSNTNTDGHINAVVSNDNTITVNYAGATNLKVTLTLYGVTGP